MGLRYKFKEVIKAGGDIYAVFNKNAGLFDTGREVQENEKGCYDLYMETLQPHSKSSSSLADPKSRPDIKEGFFSIRTLKLSEKIPLACPDLPLDPGW